MVPTKLSLLVRYAVPYGALFCTFLVEGEPNRASSYFKNINGKVVGRFDIISDLQPSGP